MFMAIKFCCFMAVKKCRFDHSGVTKTGNAALPQ
jgi:hypothetical protein